ncbi:Omega-amidase NIT2 [Papilio machaon]|uniref:omega-amidase n=1 Tax=Papilio machaon TaxID=76193 RepID=A0A0N0PBM9_PAPMA|nr:Omega-amidase NIT2 [Papilio machaon]
MNTNGIDLCESTTDAVHPRFAKKPVYALGGFKIAIVQLAVGPDKTKNIANAVKEIHKAKDKGAQLIALPECFNSPYGTQYFNEYAEEVPSGATCRALSQAAAEAGVCVVGGTLPERCGTKLYNTCTVWDSAGKLLAKHRKVHLFDIDIPNKITFKESEVLSAGDQITTFEFQGVKIGLGICYDLRFPEMARLMSDQDIPNKITFKESEVLSAGDQITTFEFQGVKIGLGICYDLRFPEMARLMADQDGFIEDKLSPNNSTTLSPQPQNKVNPLPPAKIQ